MINPPTPSGTGRTYNGRLDDAEHRCTDVYDEIKKMSLFVNELLPNVQTIVARF